MSIYLERQSSHLRLSFLVSTCWWSLVYGHLIPDQNVTKQSLVRPKDTNICRVICNPWAASSTTQSGSVLQDHSDAYWNITSLMHLNSSVQGKTKPPLNYKMSFALLAQIETELKSNSKANHVLYLENVVMLYWDVKMLPAWWHCTDSWYTGEQSAYTGAEAANRVKKKIGNVTGLRKVLH